MQFGPPQAIFRKKGLHETGPSSLAARTSPWAHPHAHGEICTKRCSCSAQINRKLERTMPSAHVMAVCLKTHVEQPYEESRIQMPKPSEDNEFDRVVLKAGLQLFNTKVSHLHPKELACNAQGLGSLRRNLEFDIRHQIAIDRIANVSTQEKSRANLVEEA